MNKSYDLDQFTYPLPEELIAQYPIDPRDSSRLLVYEKGVITHDAFRTLNTHLPKRSLLVFNNAKVIPARTYFHKTSGALIQLFLLEPAFDKDIQIAMSEKGSAVWECMVGNLKKWKENQAIVRTLQIEDAGFEVRAYLLDRLKGIVRFEWDAPYVFSELIAAMGSTPLPPYIDREVLPEDKERYQTVYAKREGAVAAPTAGLHFSKQIMEELLQAGHKETYITLHVGAGTFQPIKEQDVRKHNMHSEHFVVDLESLKNIRMSANRVAVGTTSLRTLESVYWMGIRISKGEEYPWFVPKRMPYDSDPSLSYNESLDHVIQAMESSNLTSQRASTELMIMPGYTIRSVKALITNFHLPQSTLIMLVAAFIGEDWKEVYREAVENKYRFLSYGDSSILIP